MKKLYIAFLWHMHQPLYKDLLTSRYYLPWVRLHSTKGYYDMISLLQHYPKAKATFNFTPSLLFQIKDIAQTDIKDDYLQASLKPSEDLSEEERNFILKNFFAANWSTMIQPLPRFQELLLKRGKFVSAEEIPGLSKNFTTNDFRDLQVLFNLTWFGWTLKENDELIKHLLEKQRNFSEEDKSLLLKRQREIVASLIPLYRQMQENGRIEISTSPYYHPILPLLYKGEGSQGFSFLEDAQAQVKKSIQFYEELFGQRPRGFWPSEGGVSKETLLIYAREGINWAATDEEILRESWKEGDAPMHRPLKFCPDGQAINIIFRDKGLSNLISFDYTQQKASLAVKDFLGHLQRIKEWVSFQDGEGLVSIILDGENPWEYYPDGGKEFLSGIYQAISEHPEMEMTTFSEFLKTHPPARQISHIISGSWIDHSFRIWIGKPEKDLAWEYLDKTRSVLLKERPANPRAWEELYIAQGSDWFWWYDDDFFSAHDDIFDLLFRTHLMNVYKILGKPVPAYLKKSIDIWRREIPQKEPSSIISPLIDGKVTSYYEWLNAGYYNVNPDSTRMPVLPSIVKEIRYGFDFTHFYLRLDTNINLKEKGEVNTIVVKIIEPQPYSLKIPLHNLQESLLEKNAPEAKAGPQIIDSVALNDILELGIAFHLIEAVPGKELKFTVHLYHDNMQEIECWPRKGYISFPLFSEEEIASQWYV